MAESTPRSLTELTLPDATRLATALDERFRQARLESPAPLHRLRAFLKKIAGGARGEEQFRGEAPRIAREQERLDELREGASRRAPIPIDRHECSKPATRGGSRTREGHPCPVWSGTLTACPRSVS